MYNISIVFEIRFSDFEARLRAVEKSVQKASEHDRGKNGFLYCKAARISAHGVKTRTIQRN